MNIKKEEGFAYPVIVTLLTICIIVAIANKDYIIAFFEKALNIIN